MWLKLPSLRFIHFHKRQKCKVFMKRSYGLKYIEQKGHNIYCVSNEIPTSTNNSTYLIWLNKIICSYGLSQCFAEQCSEVLLRLANQIIGQDIPCKEDPILYTNKRSLCVVY